MVDFLLFAVASVGMTAILVRGTLFQPFRLFLDEEVDRIRRRRERKNRPPQWTLVEFLHGLIGCMQCCGFWSGLFCGLFLLSSDSFWIPGCWESPRVLFNRVLMLFCCGAAGSVMAMFFDIVAETLFVLKESIKQLPMPHHHEEERRFPDAEEQIDENQGV